MYPVTFVYRHPDPIYFSIEKLFNRISEGLAKDYPGEFHPEKIVAPCQSKLRNLTKNIAFVRRKQRFINHITGDIYYAILGCNRRNINIMTVHDCGALYRYSRLDLRYWILKWLWYDLPVRKAEMVTVISEYAGREVMKFTGCRPEKIRVIPNFVDPAFQPFRAAFRSARPRILFIGTTPNKNLGLLMEALAGLTVELEIVGQLDSLQTAKLQELNISYRHSAGLGQEELIEKYQDCDLLAFPSTYEGFGLPILEAQAVGRPVLTSSLSPMKEVAGAGACLVEPDSAASIREGLLRIINDEAYREHLIREGHLNVQYYQLEKVISEYASLYRELVAKR